MKTKIILINILFFSLKLFTQNVNDNVEAVYDSLEKIYFFNSINFEHKSKFNFKPNEIPTYSPEIYKERILKLAARSPFNYRYNNVVQNYITMYSKRIKSTGTILSLSELYFPIYEKYLNLYGLPLELKYLSIVESALNPTAVSPCGASGLWQFMYGTAKSYKLTINSYVDERFDPEKETIIACAYLKDLYKIYGQWDLAIAAYNCGPGNVNKGIRKAGGLKDFWAIYDYLPKETQGYVPAFIAASYICEYHEEHNIQKGNAPFLTEDLDIITLNYKTNLKQLSNVLKIDYKKLKYLNPKYITGIIPGINNEVIVPKDKALEWIDIETYLNTGKKPIKEKVVTQEPLAIITNTKSTELPKAIPITEKPKEKSHFGTIYYDKNIASNKILKEQNTTLIKEIEKEKSVIGLANGNQILFDGSPVSVRINEDLFLNNTNVPKHSILVGKALFKKNSILINFTALKTVNNTLTINLLYEIEEKPNKKYNLEDGFMFLLKI